MLCNWYTCLVSRRRGASYLCNHRDLQTQVGDDNLALLWSCCYIKLGAGESSAQPSYRLDTYTASSRKTGSILRPCVFIVACLTSTPRGAKVSYSDKKEAWRWHRTSVVGLARHKKKHIQLHFQEKALWEHDEHSEDDIKG